MAFAHGNFDLEEENDCVEIKKRSRSTLRKLLRTFEFSFSDFC